MTSQHVGLFEGYGGLTMATRAVLGGDLIAYSEIEPAAVTVLEHHHSDVPNLGDVTQIDWADVASRLVDPKRRLLLTGGFPCTDVSPAGRKAGLRPDTRSGLWAHMARGINVLRPDLVVIENVRGLLSAGADAPGELEPCPWCLGEHPDRPLRALGAVLGDLAVLGYDSRWIGLRASDAGAPHERFRIFILARPAADADIAGLEGVGVRRGVGATAVGVRAPVRVDAAWGSCGPAIRHWERILGRNAPAPTVTGQRGSQQLSPAFAEWMMGLPGGHVTGVPGLTRKAMIQMLGNGVVPAQAALALRAMLTEGDVAPNLSRFPHVDPLTA